MSSDGKSYKDLLKFYTPGILAFFAALLGTAGNLYCETVQFQQQDDSTGDLLVVYGGVWTFRTNKVAANRNAVDIISSNEQVCVGYQSLVGSGFDYDLDGASRFVIAFSVITPIIGGLALFLACAGPCCTVPRSRWRTMGGIFCLCGIFQGFTLAVMQSSICKDNPVLQYFEVYSPDVLDTFSGSGECQAYTGYYLSIIAVVLWISAGFAALVLPSPQVDGRQPQQTQTVTYQRDQYGNVTESNVVVVKGTNVPPPEQSKTNAV